MTDIIHLLAIPYQHLGKWFGQDFWLTRFIFMRALGGIYFVAFLGVLNQFKPLIGEKGLLPASLYLQKVGENYPHVLKAFWKAPTLFWVHISDNFMLIMAILGVSLSAAVMLGLSNGISMLTLWVIYMSFVHVGQLFYGYGWEFLLLETGFLAIFMYPFFNLKWFPAHHPPPKIILFLLLWVLFRNMFGAGLIKLRGHPCWKDLSCLFYHFETQPIPNPLSSFFHNLPKWMLKGGVVFNHFVELIVPIGYFLTAPFRIIAGFFTVIFQGILILSGNLSWLNWLTLVLCIPCFDDRIWKVILPQKLTENLPEIATFSAYSSPTQVIFFILGSLIACLSIAPIKNLIGSHQAMNASHNPLRLVNSYGAFGHIGTQRNELIILGSNDLQSNQWKPYEFKAKPGDTTQKKPIISPYHYRLDWQIWFAAMGTYQQNPWLIHFLYKLLQNDTPTLKLLKKNPFQDAPPKYIKIDLYHYKLPKKNDDPKQKWTRSFIRPYLPPINKNDQNLQDYLRRYDWL